MPNKSEHVVEATEKNTFFLSCLHYAFDMSDVSSVVVAQQRLGSGSVGSLVTTDAALNSVITSGVKSSGYYARFPDRFAFGSQ